MTKNGDRIILEVRDDGRVLQKRRSRRKNPKLPVLIISMYPEEQYAVRAVKAGELHLSPNTIRTFRARILEKISVKKTNELIHYAIAHNLTEQ